MTIQNIEIDRIVVGERLREVDPDWVAALAVSIQTLGLLEPIIVRRHFASTEEEPRYLLVAGAHRLAGAEEAGLDLVPAHISEMSADEARLAEIDENLMRQELTALDRAVFLAERKSVYERLHPDTKKGGDRRSQEYKDETKAQSLRFGAFTSEAAEKCGLSKRTIQDAIALADALSPEVRKALSGTDLARNAKQLKELAKQPEGDRLKLVEIMQAKGMIKVLDAIRELRPDAPNAPIAVRESPEAIWMRKMLALWATADTRGWQDRFLASVGHSDKGASAK